MNAYILIITAACVTAIISGLFGMAGGMIFMGVIAVFLGVAEAMVLHGAVQGVSNSTRAYFLRRDVRWDILGWTALGAIPAALLMLSVAFLPSKAQLYLALGLLPLLLWLPRSWLAGDAQKPAHAVLCGAMVMGLNLSAGVAGPALDFFYVKTQLTRQQIVATKAVTMFASHLVKIVYFGIPLARGVGLAGLPPWWVFVAAVPAVIAGTWIGTRLLHHFSDIGFKRYTRILVTLIGAVYVWRGFALL
ncbi:TSUP family transporter [Algimonas porphyrae]|uniref:Probable membrane transporter protein n=1 Tax=Algimonas porphyrae TaxID=1128113 RepID=A0ABQ5V4Q2_9PROT|nr:sulfite exporter TauE/SafE family protein [Algimonas porphyrae]GLQ21939.1 permease [Algimonas porphyrae]